MSKPETSQVEFTEEAVKGYLDEAIRYWREEWQVRKSFTARCYIDAFQSMRLSLFGETLPEEDK
jgi:hypothetical protein